MPKPLSTFLRLTFIGAIAAVALASSIILYLQPRLPDAEKIRDIQLQIPLRIYASGNVLIGEFGEKRRTPVEYQQIPETFIKAVLAAEDDNFFNHRGIDIPGLLRAAIQLATTGHIRSGGSTITMQVAKNYFLTRERTFTRKFTEILLAIQLEQELSKQEILELYLNKIFLGHRAYGIQAAAQVYYGKSVDQITLAQQAMIAGLPKAPSAYNPLSDPKRAKQRRDWILSRMHQLEYINESDYIAAKNSPVTAAYHGPTLDLHAPYVAEMVRQEVIAKYGLQAYTAGLTVFTTIDSHFQKIGQEALLNGLLAYDSRHGYRGPETHVALNDEQQPANDEWLKILARTPAIGPLVPAVVSEANEQDIMVLTADGQSVFLSWEQGLKQARPYLSEDRRGRTPKTTADILKIGDLVRIRLIDEQWHLSQLPAAQSALISLRPSDGAILTLVGGFNYGSSQFNRATQARRQPGSNFKPFLYATALDSGFTPATMINDAPVVFDDSGLENTWRPENSSGKFFGPTPLRQALYKSRNLVSIRLLRAVGIDRVRNNVAKFGFDTSQLPQNLSLALGTQTNTPMEIVSAYAILANGGFKVEPYLIDHTVDKDGNTIFKAEPRVVCSQDCEGIGTRQENASLAGEPVESELGAEAGGKVSNAENTTPSEQAIAPHYAEQVIDPRVIYLVDSILQDTVRRGTATRAKVLERSDLAGKTGTTNGPTDAWFSGYNPDVVTTAWLGFDRYEMLGKREFGGSAALPIWIDFMREALKDSPDLPRTRPQGVVSARIDPKSGLLAHPNQDDGIFELFLEETIPTRTAPSPNAPSVDSQARELEESELF
ncbi:MAG: penicillin-binding protein 1A [Pseudomonadales bacterium]